MTRLFLCWFLSCAAIPLFAQSRLSVPATHFARDVAGSFLLVQAGTEVLDGHHSGIITPIASFNFVDRPATLRYDSSYRAVSNRGDSVFIAFTPLPLIQITVREELDQYAKRAGQFSFAHGASTVVSPIGLRYRGSFSLRYPKKSLDLEFRRADDPGETADVTFPGLRDDDDWVLDALYNEPSRVNAYVAHKVWLDLHTLPYRAAEPGAKPGADVDYVEVFLNGRYEGLFLLSEQVDRKQLKLKKHRDGIRGELYKAVDYTPATEFRGVPDSPVKGTLWAGWEVKYPGAQEVNWDHVRNLIRFVNQSNDAEFRGRAGDYFNLENLADYLLYVNALNLADNLGKNAYLARYDASEPYFFVPWDLDAALGNAYDGGRLASAENWKQNRLFDRLIEQNVDGFKDLLCTRYNELRDDLLRPDSLRARVATATNYLKQSGAYRREEARWPDLLNYSEEQAAFTDSFIVARINFLDDFVCGLTTPTVNLPAETRLPALRVFPNPASRQLRVVDPGRYPGAPYVLYSADGRQLRNGTLPSDGRITLPELTDGLYFLRVGRLVRRVVVMQ